MASHIAGLYHLGGGGVHTAVIDADYAGDISHPTFPNYPVTVPKIGPAVPKDFVAKTLSRFFSSLVSVHDMSNIHTARQEGAKV